MTVFVFCIPHVCMYRKSLFVRFCVDFHLDYKFNLCIPCRRTTCTTYQNIFKIQSKEISLPVQCQCQFAQSKVCSIFLICPFQDSVLGLLKQHSRACFLKCQTTVEAAVGANNATGCYSKYSKRNRRGSSSAIIQ